MIPDGLRVKPSPPFCPSDECILRICAMSEKMIDAIAVLEAAEPKP